MGLNLDMSSEASFCDTCAKAKLMCKPVPQEHTSAHVTNIGEKIHSDMQGPATPQRHYRKEYFISFTDDHSHWSCVEPMSCKGEALTQYKNYEAWLKNKMPTN